MSKPSFDWGKIFTFPFDDAEWPKVFLIGAVAVLLSTPMTLCVGMFALLGYSKVLFRGIVLKQDARLPRWEDFASYLTDGVKAFVVALPYLVLMWAMSFAPAVFASAFNALGGGTILEPALCCCGFFPLTFGAGLLTALLMPLALSLFYATEDMRAGLDFPKIIALLRSNLNLTLLLFVAAVLSGILAAAGTMVFFFGVLFTGFWALLTLTHAMAQVWVQLPLSPMAPPAPDATLPYDASPHAEADAPGDIESLDD
jgi:hypothetical protein